MTIYFSNGETTEILYCCMLQTRRWSGKCGVGERGSWDYYRRLACTDYWTAHSHWKGHCGQYNSSLLYRTVPVSYSTAIYRT